MVVWAAQRADGGLPHYLGLAVSILCLRHSIFRLSLFDRLQVRVCGIIRPAPLESNYVIDDLAGAWPCRKMRGWARMVAL